MIRRSGLRSRSLTPLIREIRFLSWWNQPTDMSPVSNFLKKGGGLHHVCYEVDDLESGLREAKPLVWRSCRLQPPPLPSMIGE